MQPTIINRSQRGGKPIEEVRQRGMDTEGEIEGQTERERNRRENPGKRQRKRVRYGERQKR